MRWTVLLLCFCVLSGCDTPVDVDRPEAPLLHSTAQTGETPRTLAAAIEPLAAMTLLNEPTLLHRFENTAEALSVWRLVKSARPTLLLLSNNPHLQPVPEPMRKRVSALINSASVAELAEASSDRRPAPLMLPGMAIDAALRNGWLREMIWALPLRDPDQELSLDNFSKQLAQTGMADEAELASLRLHEQAFSGQLRNTPFKAAALQQITGIDSPVIIHIDLSYFQPLYKNEIATPILDVVFNTLATLKEMKLETLAVTFSYGHLDSQISLDVRFLGDIVSYLIEDPARLDQPIPINWKRQRDALYLANFFQKEEIYKLHLAQDKDEPGAAWVKFNLYRAAASEKQGSQALAYLAEAVSLDPPFAREYLSLSDMAYERQRPDEALRMLSLAAETFPEDVFIKLQMAQLAGESGEKTKALSLLDQLSTFEWSKFYYPQMPEDLENFKAYLQQRK